MSYPNGKTVKYTYDGMNRLVSVKGIDGATTKYSYDAMGRRIATDGAKEDTSYTYDEMGNLISQTTTGAYDLALEYAYDLSGRMTKESRTENGATLESSYIYDALGQLTGFERSDGITEAYTYDPVGNMLTKTVGGVKTQYSYNAANQLVSDGENRYVYDANGNLTQKGNVSYAYNALNLLQSWTDGEHSETYTYNANGLLNTITNAEGTTSLTWDILMGDGVVISASINGEETNYTYGLERISAQTGNRKTEYVYDGRGSVAAEVSYNNAWYTFGGAFSKKDVTTKSYTPFGEQIGEQVSGFGYNGEYYNAATGMVYLRARFYEPAMNRFSQKDIVRGSITAPNSLNRYTYVQNDPINFIDPSGQSLKSAWNMVKSSVTNTVKNIVSNPVQAVKSVAKAVVNAVTHPIKTATNAAKSAGNAVRTIYNEVRTPDSQSKYASPATNRGTGSSYSGSSGGGAYTAPVYSPYDSNGNATSYNNSSYQSGKAPSPDAPRIEDVTADSVYYCSIAKREPNKNNIRVRD